MVTNTKKTIALLCAIVFLCVSLIQAVVPVFGVDADSGGAPVLTSGSQDPERAGHPNTHSGNWALRMDLSGQDWKAFSTMIDVTPETYYVLQFWLKGSGKVHCAVKDSSWEAITYDDFFATDTWTQCSLSFNSGSDTKLPLQFVDVSSSGIVYIDDITLKAEGQEPALIPNGDFEQGPGTGGFWCEDGCIAAIVQPANYVESSDINPVTAEYNLLGENNKNLVILVNYNGNELLAIRNGDYELISGSDYIISDGNVIIKKEYLDTLEEGIAVLTFDFDNGDDPTLSINVTAYNSGIVDELADFSKMYSYSNLSTVSPGDVLGNDADRVFPSKLNEKAYFIYEADEDITSFVSGVWYWAQRPIQDIIVSVSTTADGIYVPVELNKETKAEVFDWPYVTYYCFDMPIENARYLKVECLLLV